MDKIRANYQQDLKRLENKPRFGYFSIPPSASAAKLTPTTTIYRADADRKVSTSPLNICAGVYRNGKVTSLGFSYTPGQRPATAGAPRNQETLHNNPVEKRQTFKPASFGKILHKSSYEYLPNSQAPANPKKHRLPDGRVQTAKPNILVSASIKVKTDQPRLKNTASMHELTKDPKTKIAQQRSQTKQPVIGGPFFSQARKKDTFSSNYATYCDKDIVRKSRLKTADPTRSFAHEQAFKPSAVYPLGRSGVFSRPIYTPQAIVSLTPSARKPSITKEPLKTTGPLFKSKPSPSVSCLKINLMRKMR